MSTKEVPATVVPIHNEPKPFPQTWVVTWWLYDRFECRWWLKVTPLLVTRAQVDHHVDVLKATHDARWIRVVTIPGEEPRP